MCIAALPCTKRIFCIFQIHRCFWIAHSLYVVHGEVVVVVIVTIVFVRCRFWNRMALRICFVYDIYVLHGEHVN